MTTSPSPNINSDNNVAMLDADSRKRSADPTPTPPTKSTRRINNITPKKVQHASKNRRCCQSLNHPAQDLTPKRTNCLQYKHKQTTWLTLKLSLPHNDQMLTPFKTTVSELLQHIQQIDAHAELISWKSSDKNIPNFNAKSEPLSSLQDYKNYFNRLYFPKNSSNGITIYPNINLGHDTPLNEIREHLSDWL